ncbi:MAG: Mth938-like domain-containing protein [Beijerinckiaceae bacterium]
MVTPTGFLPGRHLIDAYGNGGFRFGDMSHRGSLLMLPSGVHAWAVDTPQQLTPAAFAPVVREAGDIELLLIGTGSDMIHLSDAIRWRFREARIAIDLMTTPAAARTFNVLLAENRRVAAALIAV